jgi:hypothetical protein
MMTAMAFLPLAEYDELKKKADSVDIVQLRKKITTDLFHALVHASELLSEPSKGIKVTDIQAAMSQEVLPEATGAVERIISLLAAGNTVLWRR